MTEMMTIESPADVEQELPVVVSWARSLIITTADDYAAAGQKLQQIKGMAKRIADFFKPMKQRQDEAKRAILDAEKKLAVPLAQAEEIAKTALRVYDDEQRRIAEEERQRLQAIADEQARKEREKAEQEAARQRQIEAEARAKAEAARKLAAEATAAEKKRLLAEAEAAERKAAAAAVKVEAKVELAAASVAPVIQVEAMVPQVAGIARRTTWKAEVTNVDAALDWIIANNRRDLLLINEKALDAYAKAMNSRAYISGVRFFPQDSIASKAR